MDNLWGIKYKIKGRIENLYSIKHVCFHAWVVDVPYQDGKISGISYYDRGAITQ